METLVSALYIREIHIFIVILNHEYSVLKYCIFNKDKLLYPGNGISFHSFIHSSHFICMYSTDRNRVMYVCRRYSDLSFQLITMLEVIYKLKRN